MKIVIIGAAGFLGSALVEYLSQNHEVIGVDKNFSDKIIELDATDKKGVEDLLNKEKPDVVIDLVALTSSVACEKDPALCKKLNYETAKNIAEGCKQIGARMVFISSAYVFDGKKGDYNEEEIPLPTNKYAETKIMAERAVLGLPGAIIIRTAAMYGNHEREIRFGTSTFEREAIEIGYPNQVRKPIFVEDVPKIIEFLLKKNQSGIFHIAGPKKIKMIDWVEGLARISGQESKVKIVDPTGWLVKSPEDSSLDTSKINSLGLITTNFEEAKEIVRNQIS